MTNASGRLLLFRVGGGRYALDLHQVAEVLEPLPEYPLPWAPPYLRGVASLHGSLVCVLDLASYLGFTSTPADRDLIVLNLPETALALAVEGVERIIPVTDVLEEEPAAEALTRTRLQLEDGPARLMTLDPLLAAVEEALAR